MVPLDKTKELTVKSITKKTKVYAKFQRDFIDIKETLGLIHFKKRVQ